MDGKNRAASSYLSPGNPPADKEQNDPLAQVFHNACSYNFFAMAELLHRLAKGERGRQNYPCVTIRHRKPCVSAPMPALPSRAVISVH